MTITVYNIYNLHKFYEVVIINMIHSINISLLLIIYYMNEDLITYL